MSEFQTIPEEMETLWQGLFSLGGLDIRFAEVADRRRAGTAVRRRGWRAYVGADAVSMCGEELRGAGRLPPHRLQGRRALVEQILMQSEPGLLHRRERVRGRQRHLV